MALERYDKKGREAEADQKCCHLHRCMPLPHQECVFNQRATVNSREAARLCMVAAHSCNTASSCASGYVTSWSQCGRRDEIYDRSGDMVAKFDFFSLDSFSSLFGRLFDGSRDGYPSYMIINDLARRLVAAIRKSSEQ